MKDTSNTIWDLDNIITVAKDVAHTITADQKSKYSVAKVVRKFTDESLVGDVAGTTATNTTGSKIGSIDNIVALSDNYVGIIYKGSTTDSWNAGNTSNEVDIIFGK